MFSLIKSVLFVYAVAIAASATAHSASVDLNSLVTVERQKALGLDNLTPEQRAGVVSLLLEAYQLGLQKNQSPNRAAPQNSSRSPQAAANAPSVIETQIDGDFDGWEGETIVKLMNGQVWQQTEYYYTYHYAFMPRVLVYRSGGGYKMKVDGVEKAVAVERLR
jgi:hypothetical protein